MQATLNTTAAPVIRPKVGRPPPLQVVDSKEKPEIAEPSADAVPSNYFGTRKVAFSVCLVLAITLVLSRALSPALHESSELAIPPIPPLAAPKSEIITPKPVAAPQAGHMVGTLSAIQRSDETESYSATPEPSIDNADRKRILSILSKD